MRIIGKGFNALLNVVRHVVDLFRQAILSQQEAKRAEQLSNNGKFLEAVSLANKILERWSSPSPSLLERQFHQWAMSDRIQRLREQLNTWQTDALIEYNAALRQAHQIAVQGRFQDAIAQFEPVHHQLPRAGGLYLLRELRRIVDGKRHFHQGLLAEKAGDFEGATEHYQNAVMYVPQLRMQCCIRLAILAVKTKNWTQALSHLEGISGEQAAYIRGFAYIKQENWQQAQQEWQSLSHSEIQQQCEVLNTLAQIQEKRDRLLAMREIEQYIDTGNLEAASSASKNFIQKFGHDPLVQANLNEHIMPCLEAAAWEEQDWLRIAKVAEQRWINQQDVTSLFREDPNATADDTNQLLATLYTVWGSVVVACQDGDLVRALQIKRGLKVSSDTEQFAYEFLSCHEGCYRLQSNRWREAIIPLRQARTLIKTNAQWYETIDRLCETRCLALETIDEYQDFIQFWDDLLDSPSAKRYLLEIKAMKIRALRTNGNFREAIWELQKLRYSQKYNPVLLDLTTSFIDLLRDDRGLLLSFEDTHLICDWAWELQSDEPTFPVPELCYRLRRITGG